MLYHYFVLVFTVHSPELIIPDDIEMQRLEASLNVCLNISGCFRVSTIQVRQYKRLTTSKQMVYHHGMSLRR